jgi:site-specific DNA recombinase
MNQITLSRATRVRCAIYTRKSSEEGLEQEFNSLHAQRDACASYIRSQAQENWRALPEIFDDGGHSGGSLERPGLKLLLAAVRARRIDVIVIYKIDRLTRSLADFARLAELFDAHGVSFVSVTQQFNTTTSMGRLMLNVLLSFAQFEREITAERIRDKIAASKKKGMWMGGAVPIGYDVRDRALHINPEDAARVRAIFDLYLACGTVAGLEQALIERGIRTKARRFASGRTTGARTFSRGHLYRLLSSPIYIGRIPHKKTSFPGMHAPIIDAEIWRKVQEQLGANTNGPRRRKGRGAGEAGMLAGLLVDENGGKFTLSHASKQGCRYHYYVGPRQKTEGGPGDDHPRRFPASEFERIVQQALAEFLRNPGRLAEAAGIVSAGEMERVSARAQRLADEPEESPILQDPARRPMLMRIIVRSGSLGLVFDRPLLRSFLTLPPRPDADSHEPETLEVRVPMAIRTRGRQIKLALPGSALGVGNGEPDKPLLRALARAQRWFDQLKSGRAESIAAIAAAEQLTGAYVARVIRLAFLSPDLVERILDGSHPPEVTADRLTLRTDMPLAWSEQNSGF